MSIVDINVYVYIDYLNIYSISWDCYNVKGNMVPQKLVS